MRKAIAGLLIAGFCGAADKIPDQTARIYVSQYVIRELAKQKTFLQNGGNADELTAWLDRVIDNIDCAEAGIERHNRDHPDMPWANVKDMRYELAGDKPAHAQLHCTFLSEMEPSKPAK